MTEAEIQNQLWRRYAMPNRHRFIVPNVTLFGWESDLVSVSKADYICEFEIKCSRSDFKADAKKYRHRSLDAGVVLELERGPALFYYVTPRDLVSSSEVPWYAGLIYSHPVMSVQKKAPRLHSVKMNDHQRQWLERSLTTRYWMRRLKSVDQGASDKEESV